MGYFDDSAVAPRPLRERLGNFRSKIVWNNGELTVDMGYLPFTWENRKFQLEDQMVRAIPIGKLQKIWAVI